MPKDLTSRRGFLAALAPLAAAAVPAAAPATPATPKPPARLRREDEPHDPEAARYGCCDCLPCYYRDRRLNSHPLHDTVITAVFRANDELSRLLHAHGCPDWQECECCSDAYKIRLNLTMAESVFDSPFYECDGCTSRRQKKESNRFRDRADEGQWPENLPTGDDAQEVAILALLDLTDALRALEDADPDQVSRGVILDAEMVLYVADVFAETLSCSMVPTVRLLRRQYPDVDADVMRYLEVLEQQRRAAKP